MFDFNSESFIIHLSFKLIEFNVCSFQKNLRKIFQKMAFQKFYLFRKILKDCIHIYISALKSYQSTILQTLRLSRKLLYNETHSIETQSKLIVLVNNA